MFHRAALILERTAIRPTSCVRRTAAAVGRSEDDRLRQRSWPPSTTPLAKLQQAVADTPVADADARRALAHEICRLRRQIALSNPLLDFQDMVFIKRHRAFYHHMCDQFYGICPEPRRRPVRAGRRLRRNPDRPRRAGRQRLRNGPAAGPNAQRRQRAAAQPPLRRPAGNQRRRRRRRLVPLAGALARRPADRLRLRGASGVEGAGFPRRPDARPLGPAAVLSHLQGQRGRQRPGAAHRRFVERLRPLLAAQRPAGVHQRAARRLPAVRPRLPAVHAVRHERRRQRNQLPELPRQQRVESERRARRPDRLDALGLRGPSRLHRPHAVAHHARRPRPAPAARQLRPASGRPDMELYVRAIPGSAKYVGLAAPHHGQAYGSIIDHQPAGSGRRRHGAGAAFHARGGFPREPGRPAGLQHALAAEPRTITCASTMPP